MGVTELYLHEVTQQLESHLWEGSVIVIRWKGIQFYQGTYHSKGVHYFCAIDSSTYLELR